MPEFAAPDLVVPELVVPEFVTVHTAEEHPGVGTILISRPPNNAFNRQAYRELTAAAAEVSARPDIAVVVLFGGHEIFSAGDDVPELRTLSAREADKGAQVRHTAIEAVAAIPKPTVAAVTGYALGSGLTLALAADWRVSGDNVKIGATEILAGLIPGGGGMARLARTIGVSRAKDLVFSGRFVDARRPPPWACWTSWWPRPRLRRRADLGAATGGRSGRGAGSCQSGDRRFGGPQAQARRRGTPALRRGVRRRPARRPAALGCPA